MKPILIESSFLYSLYNPSEQHHTQSQTFAKRWSAHDPLIPEVVMTEVAFLFGRKGGIPAIAKFLAQFAKAGNAPIGMFLVDFQRAPEIMLTYPKSELDFVDCSIMALSERLNITQVCTYDRRDFSIFRPRHCDYLELLP